MAASAPVLGVCILLVETDAAWTPYYLDHVTTFGVLRDGCMALEASCSSEEDGPRSAEGRNARIRGGSS